MHFYIFNTNLNVYSFVSPNKPDVEISWLNENFIGQDIIKRISKFHPIEKVKLFYVLLGPSEAEVANTPDRYFMVELTTNRSDKTYRYPIGYYDYYALAIDAVMEDLKRKKIDYFGGEEIELGNQQPKYLKYRFDPDSKLFIALIAGEIWKRKTISTDRGRFKSLYEDYQIISNHFKGLKISMYYYVPLNDEDEEFSSDWRVNILFYVKDTFLAVSIDAEKYEDFETSNDLLNYVIAKLLVDHNYTYQVFKKEYFTYSYRKEIFLFVANNITGLNERENIMAVSGLFKRLANDFDLISGHFKDLKVEMDYCDPMDTKDLSDDWYLSFKFHTKDKILELRIEKELYEELEDSKRFLDFIIVSLYIQYNYRYTDLETRIQNGIKLLNLVRSPITNYVWNVFLFEEIEIYVLNKVRKLRIYHIVSTKNKENMYMAVGEDDLYKFLKKFDNGTEWVYVTK